MSPHDPNRLGPLSSLIFASRWLQLPLYLGLIVAQAVYVWQFGVELVHLVSDFASYNRLNLALQTDYDYRDIWRSVAFAWDPQAGEPAGDNTRGLRTPERN